MSPAAALNLAVLDDGGGGLILLLTDGRSLVQHERLSLPDGGLSAWAGDAWSSAASDDDLRVFGLGLADLLLPAPLRAVLAGQPPCPGC